MDETATQAMWSRGSYVIVGDWFADASIACLEGLDLEGQRLLDVACGTGAVAIEAARRGAVVRGVDLTPSMLAEAARRGDSAGVSVDWAQGSFTDLTGEGTHDLVTSAFGVIFAEDPPGVASQLANACHPGGTIAVVAWAPEGPLLQPAAALLALLPPGPPMPDRTLWATTEGLATIVAGLPLTVAHHERRTIAIPFASVEDAVLKMRRHAGGWMQLFAALDAVGQADAGQAIMIDHLEGFATPTADGILLHADYTISRLTRT